MSATTASAVFVATPSTASASERAGPRRPLAGSGPWLWVETAVAAVVGAVGLGGLIASWAGAARKTDWRDQLPWMALGALFTMLAVVAVVGWIVVGLRRLRAALRDLRGQRENLFGSALTPATTLPSTVIARRPTGTTSGESLVMAAGMQRAHHPDCLLVRGKTLTPVSPANADARSRCGVCSS